jgi:hypothetical protein
MGNYNTRAIKFCQSKNDFPLTVSLGEKVPSCSLKRWNGCDGLRFAPLDDEGFELRGDKRQLVYKGRRRSHRYTILSDGAFEYDCILLREPESNVITLYLEGAENFDFFRQPDFVPDDFLKGSYAVYKKETLIGEGTGKLCHINRPLIIDARGRKCWGELSFVGNELRITIPEQWLSQAKYPVVVDPTIGTTTVGSQHMWDADPPEPWEALYLEMQIPVNRFLVPETINGLCTAYFYTNQDDSEAGGRPVLYSDNNNVPQVRRSTQEGKANFRVIAGNPPGWRSATFRSDGSITSGTNIWFGCFTEYSWYPRFDYGAKCYLDWFSNINVIPNPYPVRNVNRFWDFKLSMYFTYASPAQNHVRTLTQGVRLTDTRANTASYFRSTVETVNIPDIAKSPVTFIRDCLSNVFSTMYLFRLPEYIRSVDEQVGVDSEITKSRDISRLCDEAIKVEEIVTRSQGFGRWIYDNLITTEYFTFPVLFVRSVQETQGITDTFLQCRDYIRSLYVEAGSIAETVRQGVFYRTKSDTVQAEGSVIRQLFIFIRLMSASIVRDFIIRRFLIAQEELVLKSKVINILSLESKIN